MGNNLTPTAEFELTEDKIDFLKQLSEHLRRSSFETIKKAGSGHLGACSSSAELMATLYFGGVLKYDPLNPTDPNRDLILVRGHLGPLRYKIFSILGLVDEAELSTYRQVDSRLKGHESMHSTPGVDITPSGSLGMILSYGVGAAISAKNKNLDTVQYVFLGDGEEQEGNISEAARHAASMKLGNLVCIMDKNGKQLSRDTNHSDGKTNIKMLWQAYGWDVLEIDGHDIQQIHASLSVKKSSEKPTIIIANTVKGKGIPGCEDHYSGYHTISTCKPDIMAEAIIDNTGLTTEKIRDLIREKIYTCLIPTTKQVLESSNNCEVDIQVNPKSNINLDDSQFHYFTALRKLLESSEKSPKFYMLTADFVRSDIVKAAKLDEFMEFIDVGIREQHMIGLAHGISVTDPQARVVINYGDAFLYRASDQINAAAQGQSNITILSEYAGLSQGQNGETHQSVGQPICLSTIPGVNFYEPGDVQDLFNVMNKSFTDNKGINYIRIHRENIPPLPRLEGSSWEHYCIRNCAQPDAVIVSSGLIIKHVLEASEILKQEHGIECRVVNVVNHHALDEKFAQQYIASDKPLFTFYNGHPRTLGDAISQAALTSGNAPRPKFVRNHGFMIGDTGRPNDLLKQLKLDTNGIVEVFLKNYY